MKNIHYFWRKGWFSFLVIGVCFLYALYFSWMKWGDLVIDAGREMYVPLQLLSGKILYRDIFYTYGPFSPYFNCLLYRLFGVHLYTLAAGGIFAASIGCVLFYKICRFFLGVFFSTIATSTFLFILAFGHYLYLSNYNFIIPYTYSSVHALIFGLMAHYFLFSWIKNQRRSSAYMFTAALSFAFLSRVEVGLFVVFSAAAAIFLLPDSGRHRCYRWKYLYLSILVTCIVYALCFSSNIVRQSNLFEIWKKSISAHYVFTAGLYGMDKPAENLSLFFKSSVYYAVLCAHFLLGAFFVGRINNGRANRFLRLLFSYFIFAAFVFLALMFSRGFLKSCWQWQYRPLPLICVVMIFLAFGRAVKKELDKKAVFIVALSVFSFLLMARMLLKVWAGHYGFYLLAPGIIIYYLFFLETVPSVLISYHARVFFRAAMLVVLSVFLFTNFTFLHSVYGLHTLKISTSKGELNVFDNGMSHRLKELIEFLSSHTAKSDKLIVFPEGIGINFMTERENPLYYYSYLPFELATESVERRIIHQIEEKEIEYIVLLSRDTTEYGYSVFGVGYGKEISHYISKNYFLYRLFGPFPFTASEYGIALFKKIER